MNRCWLALCLALPLSAAAQDVAYTTDPKVANAMVFQGAYSSGTTYAYNDVVTSGGVAYVSKIAGNTGNAVTDTTKWAVLAASGGAVTGGACTSGQYVVSINSAGVPTCGTPASGGASAPATTNVYRGNGSANGVVAASPGTDYVKPNPDGSIGASPGTQNGSLVVPIGTGGDALPTAAAGFGAYSWLSNHPYFVPPTGSAIQLDFNAPNTGLPGYSIWPLNSGTCTSAMAANGTSDAAVVNCGGLATYYKGTASQGELATKTGLTNGTYTNANVTVAGGQITAVGNGAGGGGASVAPNSVSQGNYGCALYSVLAAHALVVTPYYCLGNTTVLFTESWQGTTGAAIDSTKWTVSGSGAAVTLTANGSATSNGVVSFVAYTGVTPGANQVSQIVFLGGSNDAEPMVGMDTSQSGWGWYGGGNTIARWAGGSYIDNFGTCPTVNTGDTMRLSKSGSGAGTTLTCTNVTTGASTANVDPHGASFGGSYVGFRLGANSAVGTFAGGSY